MTVLPWGSRSCKRCSRFPTVTPPPARKWWTWEHSRAGAHQMTPWAKTNIWHLQHLLFANCETNQANFPITRLTQPITGTTSLSPTWSWWREGQQLPQAPWPASHQVQSGNSHGTLPVTRSPCPSYSWPCPPSERVSTCCQLSHLSECFTSWKWKAERTQTKIL